MADRQVLWYKSSKSKNQFPEGGEEVHSYNILIVNTPDQIPLIRQKFYEEVQPILIDKILKAGKITGSDLSFELINLVSSRNHDSNFSRAYHGKCKWDRRLQPRKTPEGWDGLAIKVSQGEI